MALLCTICASAVYYVKFYLRPNKSLYFNNLNIYLTIVSPYLLIVATFIDLPGRETGFGNGNNGFQYRFYPLRHLYMTYSSNTVDIGISNAQLCFLFGCAFKALVVLKITWTHGCCSNRKRCVCLLSKHWSTLANPVLQVPQFLFLYLVLRSTG